jgi:molybdopterin converting factor small subunit
MPRVIIPFPLRKHADNQREVVIDGGNLRETIERLLQQYPGFESLNDNSVFVSIFINHELVRAAFEKWGELLLNRDDEVTLVIPIAGG